MCRWLAYHGEPVYLSALVTQPDHSLIHQSLHASEAKTETNGDGFGLGWYGSRDVPGLYREILPAWNDDNLRHLADQIQSRLFFAHVRASTGTATTRANCHPFTWNNWLFMHNGQIGGYGKVRRALENRLPDDLYASRLGTTDSELLFKLMIMHGLEQDPIEAVRTVLEMTRDEMRKAGIESALRFTACLSDGERIFAFRCASDDAPPTLYHRRNLKGDLIVVSEPLDDQTECWNSVPPHHTLCADGDGVHIKPFSV
ncbi:class II glutamine amidotransferase [Coralliovum pocilloporae]|uniref:class II glutamine amidotransferase n=1 Tax=Coralliovum pocilloporae TaxID=3066369 RepID=UPI003307B030